MPTELELRKFFLQTANLPGVFLWDQPLSALPEDAPASWAALYQVIEKASMLRSGKAIQYNKTMAERSRSGAAGYCTALLTLWLETDDLDPMQAYEQINSFVAGIEALGVFDQPCRLWDVTWEPTMDNRSNGETSLLEKTDQDLAACGSLMLRLFVFSHLEEIKPAQIVTASSDLARLRALPLTQNVIRWFEFLIDYTQSREFAEYDRLIEICRTWNTYCTQWPDMGDGHAYMSETLVWLELADQHEKAMQLVDSALAQRPDEIDYLIIKTRLLKRQGRFDEAVSFSSRLIERNPDDHSGYCLRSNAYFLAGHYDQALADAQHACAAFPENPDCHMARAYVFLQSGHFQKALQDFEKVLVSKTYQFEALRGQGKCLSMMGRDLEALEHFQTLKRQTPDDPDVFYEMADIYFAAGYLDDCERACRRCLRLDPSYVSAYVILGLLALRRDQDDEARSLLTRAVEMEPDNPFALNELSYLKHLDGDDELAFELVNRALNESPDYADAFCNKGTILYYLGEFEESTSSFGRAIALFPDHVNALVGRGNALAQLFEFEAAQASYDRALELEEDNLDACYGKIMLFRMMGLEREAHDWQEKAWRLEKEIGQDEAL